MTPRILLVTPYGFQNQGVRLLSSILEREGFPARVLFLKRWVNNDIRPPTRIELALFDEMLVEFLPEIIGFGFGTPYLEIVSALTERVREKTRAHIVWGGVQPTIMPEDGEGKADSVCVGEGEFPLLELVTAFASGERIDGIPNLWVWHGGEVRRNPLRPLIQDLDGLPYDRLFPPRVFIIEDGCVKNADPLDDSSEYRIFASRGCPFRCAFCYNSQYRTIYEGLGAYHRIRGVESVIEELRIAKSRLRALRRVKFDDDSFIFPANWVEEFAEKYPARVGLPFEVLMKPETCNGEMLRTLRRAGLSAMQVGIQSASARENRESYERTDANKEILEMAESAKRVGISVFYDVILDNPLAVREDKEEMLDFLLRLPRPFYLYMYSLNVFPRSEIARRLLDAGLISQEDLPRLAAKSHRQFRLTLNYPRPPEETFYASLISLTSKGFFPRSWTRWLSRREGLRRRPGILRALAQAAGLLKMISMAWRMMRDEELTRFKLREYGSPRRWINL